MPEIKWVDNHLEIVPPKKCKKITATRFATILGLNPWATPFEMWCAITRTYEPPFEDNMYTLAGKTIEPLQIEYMRKAYVMNNLVTPTDRYGADYFNKTWGEFFPEEEIFGGMWDALLVEDGETEAVLEFKTTKRSEDWIDNAPEYYALQAALYAYLLGCDDVIMVASFLEAKDYEKPEKYKPSAKNTITVDFKLSEKYPNFEDMVNQAIVWWNSHVVTGISPDFDEKKDAEILKVLRTNTLSPDTDINALIEDAETIKAEIDTITSEAKVKKILADIADKEKKLKKLNDVIKEHALTQFRDSDKKVDIKGSKYTWSISRTESTTIDKAALEADGLLEKYSIKTSTYRMSVK